jgi:RNA polymerase sigma-B factor
VRNIVSRSIYDEREPRRHEREPRRHERELRRHERELWRRRRDGDDAAREALVNLYLPLAWGMAKRYAGVREPFDDLLQVASLGLLNAIDRYEPDLGTPFVGFARPTILGELKRHLRDKVWTVRVPRLVHDRLAAIEAAVDALTEELGRPPSVSEIAEATDIGRDDVLEALEASFNRKPVSLDAPESDAEEDSSPRIESIGGDDRGYAAVEDRATVAAALARLDAVERDALLMRFEEELTQRQIGARLGMSQMSVSRLLRRSLASLREATEA